MQHSIPIMRMDTGMNCPINADFRDDQGNPFTPSDTPTWQGFDPAIATVTAAPDGLSATVEAIAPGETECLVNSADLDEPSKFVIKVFDPNIPNSCELVPGPA